MTKNRTMRVAVIMLALTLITSCFVGGTFAKYTTEGNAGDSARVAKWGVTIETLTDASSFADTYMGTDDNSITVVQAYNKTDSAAGDNLVAPGTSSTEAGTDLILHIAGTPEVATKVNVEFDATQDIYYDTYNPVVFSLYVIDNNAEIDTNGTLNWGEAVVTGTLAEIAEAINNTYGEFTTEPNETLDALFKITWEWAYNVDDDTDVMDTALGNLMATETDNKSAEGADIAWSTALEYGVTVTITQID